LKRGILKVYRNKEKLGQVHRFKFDPDSDELNDGYTLIHLPEAEGRSRILPQLSILAREAGISGLDNYQPHVVIRTKPGRTWRVVTPNGIYVRHMFSVKGNIIDVVPHNKELVEIESKQILDQLWVRHEDGWCLARKSNGDGSRRILMSVIKEAEEKQTKKIRRKSKKKIKDSQASIASQASVASQESLKSACSEDFAKSDVADVFTRLALRRKSDASV